MSDIKVYNKYYSKDGKELKDADDYIEDLYNDFKNYKPVLYPIWEFYRDKNGKTIVKIWQPECKGEE